MEVLFGAGAYTEVVRDCNGDVLEKHKIGYSEVGAAVTQQLGVVRLRLSGGRTDAPTTAEFLNGGATASAVTFVAPAIGLHGDEVGFDLGYLFVLDAESPFTDLPPEYAGLIEEERGGTPQGRLRIGREDRTHFLAQYAFDVPASAGTGAADVGLGFNPGRGRNRYWVGLGLLPDEALLAGFKGDIWLTPGIAVAVRGHFAFSGEAPGYGGAIGTKIRF
jgi:hypothetical protein